MGPVERLVSQHLAAVPQVDPTSGRLKLQTLHCMAVGPLLDKAARLCCTCVAMNSGLARWLSDANAGGLVAFEFGEAQVEEVNPNRSPCGDESSEALLDALCVATR
jgi:hypothetical protein